MNSEMTVAIMAGGMSQRMRQDKAQLPWGDDTLLVRLARVALCVTPRALVIGRAQPEGWNLAKVDFVPDETPGAGPLGGIKTALGQAQTIAAIACDMPLLSVESLHWLIEQGRESEKMHSVGNHGVIVDNGGQWEPLFSVYRRACLPIVEANLAKGQRSLHGLIKAGDFAFVHAPIEISATLVNVNTPEEWKALTERSDC